MSRKIAPSIAAGVLLSVLSLAPWAEAHYLWIETAAPAESQKPRTVRVYYGEFEESLRERAGGRLDEVGKIQAWVTGPEQTQLEVACEKQDEYFEGVIPEKGGSHTVLVQLQELNRPVQDWRKYSIGIVKPNFYASALALGEGDAGSVDRTLDVPAVRTTLGVYPLRVGSDLVLQVFFRGKPLPQAKVNVHAQNGWSKELNTDASGGVHVAAPWAGQYVIEVIHLEHTPGEFQGASYEAVRHRATFTWTAGERV